MQLIMSEYLRDSIDSSIACFWLCLVGSTYCVILYHLTCRATPIGILLSGRRYSLSITNEWNAFKTLFNKRSVQLTVVLIVGGFFIVDRLERRTERKLLFFSSRAEPENIMGYINGKSADELNAITRSGGRNAMHMVAHNMPVARPAEKISECVMLLLDAGLDPMSRDDFGQTPLHYAVRNGNDVALRLLLKAGRTRMPKI